MTSLLFSKAECIAILRKDLGMPYDRVVWMQALWGSQGARIRWCDFAIGHLAQFGITANNRGQRGWSKKDCLDFLESA